MSDTLRYMNDNGKVVEGEAANAFLQNKLRDGIAGRYTQQQMDRLSQSGGPAVVNSNDGYIPTGDAYPQNNFLDEGKSSGDGAAAGKVEYGHMTGDSDTERNYREGNWGQGGMSAEEIAEKFGLDRSNEGQGEGHVWGTNPDGSKTYIGFAGEDLRSNSDLIKAHGKQKSDAEMSHSDEDGLSSSGDVKGALLTYWQAEGAKGEGPAKEQKPDPIRHSPELKQATERVRAYENDVMSGKTSDDIFSTSGGYNGDNNYTFDYNKGSAGIGTAAGAESNVEAKAASNFLADQTTKIKKDYNFQPAENSKKYAYGAN